MMHLDGVFLVSERPINELDEITDQRIKDLTLMLELKVLSSACNSFNDEAKKACEAELNISLLDVDRVIFSEDDMMFMLIALDNYSRYREAEKYIRNSYGQNIKSEKRWSTASEIVGLKKRKKSREHGHLNEELVFYILRLKDGFTPNEAAEKVKVYFNWTSDDACNKWLYDEITRYKKIDNNKYRASSMEKGKSFSFFGDLPKPQKSPTKK